MTEYSSGAVLFARRGNEVLYCLVVRLHDDYAGFPKGHIEHGETEKEAALREIREEACVNAIFVPGFRMETEYTMENGIKKHVVYFLAEAIDQTPESNPDEQLRVELLPYNAALERLSFQNTRDILTAADEFVRKAPLPL